MSKGGGWVGGTPPSGDPELPVRGACLSCLTTPRVGCPGDGLLPAPPPPPVMYSNGRTPYEEGELFPPLDPPPPAPFYPHFPQVSIFPMFVHLCG